jgi:ppGpp synthetase/RelA/SpoT-type nucleotidyltranferase
LIVKIVTKYLDAKPNEDSLKYLSINADNYYKIITDIIGFRIVMRFPQEWGAIDNFLRGSEKLTGGVIEDDENKYIRNWDTDHRVVMGQKPFLAEKPTWYYLEPDQTSPMFPMRDELDEIIKQRFDIKPTQRGYRSIHYLINSGGNYIELQVRTLAEEAWAECEHEMVYKSILPDGDKKDLLTIYTKLYANIIVPITYITQRMYELAKSEDSTPNGSDLYSVMASLLYVTGNLIQRVQKYGHVVGFQQHKADFVEHIERGATRSISTNPIMENGKPDALRVGDFSKIFF